MLGPLSSGFQHNLKTSSSPGILQAFSTRLGLIRHPALWAEQLLDSWPLQCETAIAGVPELHPVSWSRNSLNPSSMYACVSIDIYISVLL